MNPTHPMHPMCPPRRWTAVAGACTLALAAAAPAQAGGVRFDLQALPVTPGTSQFATALNASGVVVGHESTLRGLATAFRFEQGIYSLLPKDGAVSATAAGISDNGLIVGSSGTPGATRAGFLGASFSAIDGLPMASVGSTFANAIDPSGRMVAGQSIASGVVRSWINTGGALTEMAQMNSPVAINLAGDVAGNLSVAHRPRAAFYSGGRLVDLGTLGGVSSSVTGLNNSGTVVGTSELAVTGSAGFIYSQGSLLATVAAPGSDAFYPAGINDLSQMVGQGINRNSSLSLPQLAGGLSAAPVDLNSLLSAGTAQQLTQATAINASGQILGRCSAAQNCLLTPTGTLAWASTTGGSFNDARHWDSGLGFAPNRHLDVLIAPAAAVTVLAHRSADFKSLVVGTTTQGASQATLQLAEGARLAGSAAISRIERSGILMGDGVLAGGLVNRGTLQGTAATPLHITVEGMLDNQGLITGSGRINANLINRGSSPGVRVGAGELLTIAGSAHSGADGSVLEVRQGGELRIEGSYTAQAGSFIRLDNATLRVSGLLNASTVQIGFGGASIFGDVNNSQGSRNGRIIASGGSETTFWGRLANHNEVRAAAGSQIVYFGDVTGAGSFTTQGAGAYHRFEAAYNPGGGAAAVVDLGNAEFNGLLALDLAGTQAGSSFDQLQFGGRVLFDAGAQLSLNLQDGFAPQAGQRFQVLQYSQAPDGQFAALNLPTLATGLAWDTADLYTGGTLGVSNVPEPATGALWLAGAGMLLWRARRRAACRIGR
jgi:hypothetical protein